MSQSVKVLVVDDDDSVRVSLARFLTRSGYDVTQAAGGAQALEQLERVRFEAMLCDIRMPGMTGVELLPRVIAHDPDIAVIMLTAVGEPDSAISCLKVGAADYLIKPVELEELAHALRFALRKRQLEVERREMEQWLSREVAEKTKEIGEQSRRVELLSLTILTALVDEADAGGPSGRNHSMRVSNLSAHVAAGLGLEPEAIEMVRLAARLHDLGTLLQRSEPLRRVSLSSPVELAGDDQAPAIAARILEPLQRHAAVTDIIRSQLERWDGRGRPRGLKGDAIPLGARIVAAVNLYDELSEAPEGATPETDAKALASVQGMAGAMLDPRVVAALVDVLSYREEGRGRTHSSGL